ncbi:MAG: DMT family transporter [Bacteroidaceae bacterium]|nr:DMT family transporter [Bacteroidaceae bacterium]
MWLILAFTSAFFLGFYDVFKKKSLKDNAVVPVLFLNVLFSSIIFLPFIIASKEGWLDSDSIFYTHSYGWDGHKYIILKSVIVLTSWVFGYLGMKNLPITIVGPINATRPVMVLIGALTFLGEHLNIWQWIGVIIAIISFYIMSRSGKREGIDFKHNKWIVCVLLANIFGALSALYDRYLLDPEQIGLDKMAVQSWFNIYQVAMMGIVLIITEWKTITTKLFKSSSINNSSSYTPSHFHWSWCIPLISVSLSIADFVYFYALSQDDAMISIVSMIRRGSVIVSFLFGAMIFKEKNLKAKVFDLLLVLLSMVFLFIGSR